MGQWDSAVRNRTRHSRIGTKPGSRKRVIRICARVIENPTGEYFERSALFTLHELRSKCASRAANTRVFWRLINTEYFRILRCFPCTYRYTPALARARAPRSFMFFIRRNVRYYEHVGYVPAHYNLNWNRLRLVISETVLCFLPINTRARARLWPYGWNVNSDGKRRYR